MAIAITGIDLGFFRLFIFFFFFESSIGLSLIFYYVFTGFIFIYIKFLAQNGIEFVSSNKNIVSVYLRPEQFYRRYIALVYIFIKRQLYETTILTIFSNEFKLIYNYYEN